jgi:hypothetical protein
MNKKNLRSLKAATRLGSGDMTVKKRDIKMR